MSKAGLDRHRVLAPAWVDLLLLDVYTCTSFSRASVGLVLQSFSYSYEPSPTQEGQL